MDRSTNMPWYDGSTLLGHLERLHVSSDRNLVDVRFPVQYVIRPQSAAAIDYRGFAGTMASGVLKPGDRVVVLPSGFETTVAGIDGPTRDRWRRRTRRCRSSCGSRTRSTSAAAT